MCISCDIMVTHVSCLRDQVINSLLAHIPCIEMHDSDRHRVSLTTSLNFRSCRRMPRALSRRCNVFLLQHVQHGLSHESQ